MSNYKAEVLSLYSNIEESLIKKAEELTPISIEPAKAVGEFVSSNSAEIYSVSLTNCTCPQHRNKGKVCKHMMRLAMLLGVPITYRRMVPLLCYYGSDEPVEQVNQKPNPIIKDYSLEELLAVLEELGIAVDDKRAAGGCIWIENTREYERFLLKLTVDGKPLRKTTSTGHFKWQYSWYLK